MGWREHFQNFKSVKYRSLPVSILFQADRFQSWFQKWSVRNVGLFYTTRNLSVKKQFQQNMVLTE
jgi:hypothetical protein